MSAKDKKVPEPPKQEPLKGDHKPSKENPRNPQEDLPNQK